MANPSSDDSPLVSIILPTYNGSKYLRLAIDSCLAQTYANFELIVVDDSSTDETPQVIAEYAARDSRIRTIRNVTNQRLPSSLNIGHKAARGSLLTWTSDDNILQQDFLAEMVGFLQEHTEIGLVYSDWAEIDDEGKVIKQWKVLPPEELAQDNVVRASFLYRRSTFEKAGLYDPMMIMAEDYDYWLRCYAVTKMATLHKALYYYRYHERSLTSTRNRDQQDAIERTLRQNLPRIVNAPRHLRSHGWLHVASRSARRKDVLGCIEAFFRATLLSPASTARLVWRKVARRKISPTG